jgi:hypothetical protein
MLDVRTGAALYRGLPLAATQGRAVSGSGPVMRERVIGALYPIQPIRDFDENAG